MATTESKKEKRERKKEKKEKKDADQSAAPPAPTSPEDGPETLESESASQAGEEKAAQNDHANGAGEPSGAASGELEIDLNAAVPLSRKRQRLLKKGKLDLAKIARKHPAPRPLAEDGTEQEPVSKKSPFGVWIGNLSFETTRDDLVRYIVAKTKANTDAGTPPVEEKDISRVNLPKKGDKIKGFAYVDVPSAAHVASVVALSESNLNGRNLLIKNASSFEGRPEDHGKKPLSKNPPSRILFVGNLSFDTTQELLEEHFRHCGEIVKIRMATFEDSGKCKGFAFVDFLREEGATTALKSKLARSFINRPLRLEYGEDRSKRAPKRAGHDRVVEGELDDGAPVNAAYRERRETRDVGEKEEGGDRKERQARPERPAPRPQKRAPERTFEPSAKRMKSSVALATAQRASAAIVPSQGKKKTFD